MKTLGKFSIGTGDRFGREGVAQIAAVKALADEGVLVDIVWNKSKREHSIIGTSPADQRRAADAAITASGWQGAYFVDADHINRASVDQFIDYCDFFTIDVADYIGKPTEEKAITAFVSQHSDLIGDLVLPGLARPVAISRQLLETTAAGYLFAVKEAGAVYRHILAKKAVGNFIVEVSMDETTVAQQPGELFLILAALADEGVPVNTIAPKFSGRFNKGVEYVGELREFLAEFEADVHVTSYAAKRFNLPSGLKLSVHSGSDKFLLYPGIGRIIKQSGAGLHLKTAGTSWLEELIGLAEAGGEGLKLVKQLYQLALVRFDELVAPYAPVVDIDKTKLPTAATVDAWSAEALAAALRHDQTEARYNLHFRQLLHVSFKLAAEMSEDYLRALEAARGFVEPNVTYNLLERHLRPLFLSSR